MDMISKAKKGPKNNAPASKKLQLQTSIAPLKPAIVPTNGIYEINPDNIIATKPDIPNHKLSPSTTKKFTLYTKIKLVVSKHNHYY